MALVSRRPAFLSHMAPTRLTRRVQIRRAGGTVALPTRRKPLTSGLFQSRIRFMTPALREGLAVVGEALLLMDMGQGLRRYSHAVAAGGGVGRL
jgi:hypothetical protein